MDQSRNLRQLPKVRTITLPPDTYQPPPASPVIASLSSFVRSRVREPNIHGYVRAVDLSLDKLLTPNYTEASSNCAPRSDENNSIRSTVALNLTPA